MKVAIVHDFLIQYGGAERVLQNILDIYHDADLYTIVHDPKKIGKYFMYDKKIFVSSLQKYYNIINKINFTKKNSQKFLMLWNIIKHVELFNLDTYDVVISNNSLFAKSVITKPDTLHITYMNTGPSRLLWDEHFTYLDQNKLSFLSKIQHIYMKYKTHKWRMMDSLCADRSDFIIANSKAVQHKIEKYYKRTSDIIYPPVDIPNNNIDIPNMEEKDFYLIVARLTPTKNTDLAVKAFNKIGKKLIIVGNGEQLTYLKQIAKPNISFVGHKKGIELLMYYKHCKAFIFPTDDDFGIAPIEAMAMGKPVIAYAIGGAKETIIPGVTGEFFYNQKEKDLVECINTFEKKQYNPQLCKAQANRFSSHRFKEEFYNYINIKLHEKNNT